MKAFNKFNELAAVKTDLKPFKLVRNKRGTRVWDSENGLWIKAVKIGSNEYYEVHITNGAKLGDVNRHGEKIKAKEIQAVLSEFATKYNFHYIKNKVQAVRNSEVGAKLYNDWNNVRTTLCMKYA